MPRAGFFHVTIQDVIEKKGDRPPSPSLPLQSSEEDRVLPTLHELRAGIWKIGRGGRPVPREAARAVLKFFLCGGLPVIVLARASPHLCRACLL